MDRLNLLEKGESRDLGNETDRIEEKMERLPFDLVVDPAARTRVICKPELEKSSNGAEFFDRGADCYVQQ